MENDKENNKAFIADVKEYFKIKKWNIFIIDFIIILLISILIVLVFNFYDFFIKNIIGQLILIFTIISITFFVKKNLNNKNETELNNEAESKINDNKNYIDYYKYKIDFISKTFTLVGVSIALLTYFLSFYLSEYIKPLSNYLPLFGILGIILTFLLLCYYLVKIIQWDKKILEAFSKK